MMPSQGWNIGVGGEQKEKDKASFEDCIGLAWLEPEQGSRPIHGFVVRYSPSSSDMRQVSDNILLRFGAG